jgi:hypothetical protein
MSAMPQAMVRLVELVFTAYMVPALLVPLVWLASRTVRRRAPGETSGSLARLEAAYAVLALAWFAAWLAVRLGVPLERGGVPAAAVSWLGYLLVNLVFAWLLVRFTSGYGGLAEGPVKDRLFLRFLALIVIQPLTTASAFTVLFRTMGVAYRLWSPELPAIQEGI